MDSKNMLEIMSNSSYDDSMWDRNTMYDKMPYVWDPDLNVDKKFTKVTGNVIKFYRCQYKEPFELKQE